MSVFWESLLIVLFVATVRLEQFDTLLMGRKSYEVTHEHGGDAMFGMDTYVFSCTLHQTDYPGVTIVYS